MALDKRTLLLAAALAATSYAQYGPSGDDDDDDGPPQSMQSARAFGMRMVLTHGILMSLAFAFMMPFGSTLIRLLKFRGTAWIHGIWQSVAYLVALAGFGIGVWYASSRDYITEPHAIIGIIVIAVLFLQPLGGIVAHIVYKRKQRRNAFGAIHRWNGRVFVTLGAINGGLGIQLASSGRTWTIAYSVVAAFFFALWFGVSLFDWVRNRRHSLKPLRNGSDEKAIHRTTRASYST